LAKWLERHDMAHVRGAPYHPMTQGKIERWHQTLKNRILLENYDSGGGCSRPQRPRSGLPDRPADNRMRGNA
jgi:putative transposase